MDKSPKSPLKILKRDVAKGFTASFIKRQKKKAEEAAQKKAKPFEPPLGYKETPEIIEASIKKTFLGKIIYTIRDIFWNYPKYLEKFIKTTRPISLLILYAAIFFGAWEGLEYVSQEKAFAISDLKKSNQTYVELTVGKPSQLNPIFITNNPVDRDIQELIFNKLIRIDKQGNPQPELAESWSISKDGKSFVFFLRKDVRWHDGERFNADDVVFTFKTVRELKSSDTYSVALEGVEITKIDTYAIKCKVPGVNALFMENISFPIIPEHGFQDVPVRKIEFSDFNLNPIGTGPYKILSIDNEKVALVKNKSYFVKEPKIEKVVFRFFENSDQAKTFFKLGIGHAISHPTRQDYKYFKNYAKVNIYSQPLLKRDRIIYLNLNSDTPIKETRFRQALSSAIDRQTLIKEFVGEEGLESTGPVQEASWAYNETAKRYANNPDEARQLLDKAGWVVTEGSRYRMKDGKLAKIELTYFESPTVTALAKEIKKMWETVGVETLLRPLGFQSISQEVIPSRDYEAMLFEIETTIDPDNYNFWHSNNVDYPGLNISGYEYDRVDILTERARTTFTQSKRKEDYLLMQEYLLRDVPMIYLYHPSYYFITHENVIGSDLSRITVPSERFWNIYDWDIMTE